MSPTLAAEPWPLGDLSPVLGDDELIRGSGRTVGDTPIRDTAGSSYTHTQCYTLTTEVP